MATIIFDSRITNVIENYKGDYDWWCRLNGYKKSEYTIEDFARECSQDETKLTSHILRKKCPRILVMSKNGNKCVTRILKGLILSEVLDTIKGKNAVLFYDMELRAKVENDDGTQTEILYRFIKNDDSKDFSRVIRKFEAGEQYSIYDFARCSSSIMPMVKEIFNPAPKEPKEEWCGDTFLDW